MTRKPKPAANLLRDVRAKRGETIVQTGIDGVQIIFSDRTPSRVTIRYSDGRTEHRREMPSQCVLVAGPRMIRAAILQLEAIEKLGDFTRGTE